MLPFRDRRLKDRRPAPSYHSLRVDALDPPEAVASGPSLKLLLIPSRGGAPARRHPDVRSHVQRGWRVERAVPRLTEEGFQLLVVLTGPTR